MSIIVTSSFQHDLQPGITSYFGDLKNHPELYSKLFDMRTSNRGFEQFTQTGELGLAGKLTEGEGIAYDSTQEGWTKVVSHVEYGTGVTITQNMIDDNQGNSGIILKLRGEYLRNAMEKTIEVVAHAKYNNATSTAQPYVGGDGAAFASASHPSLAGNLSNIVTGNAPLSELAIEQACIQIKGLTTHRGLKANIMPKMLVVPDALEFEAERLLGTEYRVGTADNDINAVKSLGKLPGGYMVDTYLTSSTAWFILTDCPEGAMFFWNRKMAIDSMNEADKRIAKFFSTMRFSTSHNDFRSLMFSAGA